MISDPEKEDDFSVLDTHQALEKLSSSEEGLAESKAKKRLAKFGLNEIPEIKKRTAWVLILKQFKSLLVIILLIAATLSWLTGHTIDALIILFVILIDAIIGFFQEYRAELSALALQKVHIPVAKVIRSSKQYVISSDKIVPGDILILEEGDYVPGDGRLLETHNLYITEASLTGESLPVHKSSKKLSKTYSLGDKRNMIWRGTYVVTGRGKAVVSATGVNTVIGKLTSTLAAIPTSRSHFQKKMDELVVQLAIVSMVAAMILFAMGYFILNLPLEELILISVAVMVSVIPEGLSGIMAIVLAIGSQRMSKKNAIVREFTSIEALGAITTLITDKTGTLTANAITAKKLYLYNESDITVTGEGWLPVGSFFQNDSEINFRHHKTLSTALRIAGVCNNASIQKKQNEEEYEMLGDPTEGALLTLAMKARGLLKSEKIDDLPFNSLLKMRASLSNGDTRELFVVGAPEVVLAKCTHVCSEQGILPLDENIENDIRKKIELWSSDAMRVIALAFKKYSDETIQANQIEQLVFAGLTGMQDPPRPNVKESIQKCRDAGIRVIMATGDHVNTALSISKEIGIINVKNKTLALTENQLSVMNDAEFDEAIRKVNVFARLNPETKLRIASRLQAFGELVAMTGDGVNDAPALKKVDVGIAMGIMGTDVARNASKVILADDNFATIVNAIEEGRIVFINTRQASFYLITTNMAEMCTLLAAISIGFPIPLTAIQILWLNIVTDGIGDIALATEHGHGDVMKEKPLNKEQKIINSSMLPFLAINVVIMVSCSLLAYHNFIVGGISKARSAVFMVMSFTQLFNMYNMRSITQSILTIGIFSNIFVTITMISSAIITIAIIEVPFLNIFFGFKSLDFYDYILLISMSSLVLVGGELVKLVRRKSIKTKSAS